MSKYKYETSPSANLPIANSWAACSIASYQNFCVKLIITFLFPFFFFFLRACNKSPGELQSPSGSIAFP